MTDYRQIDRLVAAARIARAQAVGEMIDNAMTRTAIALRRLAASIAARIAHLRDAHVSHSGRIAATSHH